MARAPPSRLSEPVPLTGPLKAVTPKALALAVIWLLPVSVMGPVRKMRLVELANVATLLVKLIGLARAKKLSCALLLLLLLAAMLVPRLPDVKVTAPLLKALILPMFTTGLVALTP